MATDLERLVVSLDADIRKFDRSLKQAVSTFNGETRKIEKRSKDMQKNVQSSFADLGKGFALGAGVTAGVMAFKDLADAATRTQNALKVAGLSGEELTRVYQQLFQAAQDNAAPVEDLVKLYSRVSINQKELGVSTQRLIGFTDNVAKALRVQGTTAEQAQGALLQLSQALGAGVVRAEEFNSILEGAPVILQAVAAGFDKANGSVAELRKIMLAGGLSSKAFFEAFERGAPTLDQKLAGSVLTIDQALVKLNNSLIDSAGKFDSVFGASANAVEVIGKLATTVEDLGRIFKSVADSDTGAFIAKLAEISGWIDKIVPGIDDIKNIPSNIGAIADALPEPTAMDKAAEAAEKLANGLEMEASTIDSRLGTEQKKMIADLAAELRAGSMGADEFDNSLFYLGSQFDDIRKRLQPLIDKLRETKEVADEIQLDEVTINNKTNPVPDSILQAQEDMKRSGFFNQRNADAMQNELEKNVETRANAIVAAAEKVGVALTEAQAKVQARSEIAMETATKTFEGAISGYVDRVISVESGGNTNAKNPNSTATGVGQFIESTWLDLFRRYYPAEAAKMGNSAILELRKDATISKNLIEQYARENAAVLQKAGVSVDEAALQLSHFLGATDAAKVLSAAPGTPLKGLISSSSIAANQSILGGGRTVDDAIAYAQKRAGMTTTGTQTLDNRESFQQNIAEQQRMLQQLKEETGLRASLNPLVNDYGRKLSELEKAQELLNMAQKEGTAAGKELTSATQLLSGDLTALTPEARAQAEAMRALATQYGVTSAAAKQLQESQEAAAKSSTESLELAKSVTGGILSDIRSALSDGKITWKEWGEIAVNALNKVADKLQEMLLNQLFSPTGGGGGLFGMLFGGGSSFNLATATPGLFAKGGYTGDGGKNQPAGVVHKGEYVFPQEAVDRIGVRNLEMLSRGYANGGYVSGRMPRIGAVPGMGASEVHVYVDDEGSLRAYVQREGRKTEARIATTTHARFENYRKNDIHDDITGHQRNQRRRG